MRVCDVRVCHFVKMWENKFKCERAWLVSRPGWQAGWQFCGGTGCGGDDGGSSADGGGNSDANVGVLCALKLPIHTMLFW